MKKVYSAPEILFEDFSLCTSIATVCETSANATDGNCGIQWGRFVVFNDAISVCTRKPEDTGGLYDGVCYHNPSDLNNLFSS